MLDPPPRLVSREIAARYVGLSPNSFEAEVAAGTFPGPLPLGQTRRRLWDLRALDAAIDRAMGLKTDRRADMDARKAAWKKQRSEWLSANRPWVEREGREKEERSRQRRAEHQSKGRVSVLIE